MRRRLLPRDDVQSQNAILVGNSRRRAKLRIISVRPDTVSIRYGIVPFSRTRAKLQAKNDISAKQARTRTERPENANGDDT